MTIAPGTNQDSVSEHCFMLLLALARNLIRQHNPIHDCQWPRAANLPIRGKTLGLVGLGRIGKSMTKRALAFGMKVVAYEPFPDNAFVESHGVKLMSLDDLLRTSDYVSLHLPAMEGTYKLINAERLKLMKPTAFLINTARGAVIDEPALYEALRDKKIAGAGLDVVEEEAPRPDNPILKLDKVVMRAGVDTQSATTWPKGADASRHLEGRGPADCQNPEVKAKFR